MVSVLLTEAVTLRSKMASNTFIIDSMGLSEAKAAIEQVLGISFEERDSSYYASAYYRCAIEKEHELKLSDNEDFGGAPIQDNLDITLVMLGVYCSKNDDDLFAKVGELGFVRALSPRIRDSQQHTNHPIPKFELTFRRCPALPRETP